MARPEFKPTKPQRERVRLAKACGWSNERIAAHLEIDEKTLRKHFGKDLEFGADVKRMQVLENLEKASAKGSASASKQLLDRFDVGQAAQAVADRGEPMTMAPKLGKKEQRQQAAEQVAGKFAPPPAPKLH